ncbi:sigma-54-dependent transcriptional regulator [Mucisphaera calidilacus]|uniref:DNA-binding transcriptional response regulator n=1 Tax=Mucisphaera calidilacus TaxID=2527982 RepID=A0A518BYU6_9BACT|nr:sigma-54 dependent transcriptional regulator [Mucisphaera calidilacus]QDU72145.1 DNA-binding transcriptional response regulator [Mucisphaera calidilacus]
MTSKDEFELPTAQVLIVDDEEDHAEVMAEALQRMGHVCTLVHDLPAAEEEIRHGQFDLIVTDLVMDREDDGMKVLEAVRMHQPQAETVMVTAHGDVPTAKQAIRGGAYDFIEKPLDLDVYRTLCSNALRTVFLRAQNTDLHQRLDEKYGFEGIVGTSPGIREVITRLRQVAPTTIPVLILGESGTGKELVAQAVHNNSKRARKTFVPLNCAGLSESILEDELFGHVRGAFTGADKERQGRFEYADGGTLFLDEVGDMPLPMQAKLLRVLESGEVVRLGSNETRHVDVRLVSATNRDLEDLVKKGEFREDLYFRIKGAEVTLPALRERRDDIPVLVRHFVDKFSREYERATPEVAEDVMLALARHSWPGNVRQLINVVQNMLVIAEGDRIEPRHLPGEIRPAAADDASFAEDPNAMSLDQIEKRAIREALRISGGNREQAARSLGIGERTLYRKLKEYGLK